MKLSKLKLMNYRCFGSEEQVKNIYEAISKRGVVMDLCIDQPASDFGKKAPHDRGPHIRISVKKLQLLFDSVEQIL